MNDSASAASVIAVTFSTRTTAYDDFMLINSLVGTWSGTSASSAPPIGRASYAKLSTCEVNDLCRYAVSTAPYAAVSTGTMVALRRPSAVPVLVSA